jgi:mannose-6-phosphate isomerase-like protein (cupin superfamily)
MLMNAEVVNLAEKLAKFSEHWSPKVIAQLNDYHVKLVKVQGDFVWHSHADTDELFLVLDGEMRIDFRDRNVVLGAGELCVVPKGIEHKPFAEEECRVLLLEPAGTVNTGDSGGDLTVQDVPWI